MADIPRHERLEAYGFGVDYPSDCVIEFNPKSTRSEGDVAFKSPAGYKLFLSWGNLKKVEKLKGVEEHADYSIKRIQGSREAEIKDRIHESRRVNGHPASYNDVRLELIKRGIFFSKSKIPQEVRSLHVHCDVSSRYFVLYGPSPPEKLEEQKQAIDTMIGSFSCHPSS